MKTIYVLLFVTLSVSSLAQKATINGIIFSSDSIPLPYVNIYYENSSSTGSTSNLDGYFIINLLNDTLTISHLGFKPFKLKPTKENASIHIYLSPLVTVLEAIEIEGEKLTAESILTEALNRVHRNSSPAEVYSDFVYKNLSWKNEGPSFLFNAYVTAFWKHYINNSKFKIYLHDFDLYKMNNEKVLFIEPDFLFNKIFIQGLPFIKNRDDYKFLFAGVSKMEDDSIFIIKFLPKTPSAKLQYKGVILIDGNDYGFHKVDYQIEKDFSYLNVGMQGQEVLEYQMSINYKKVEGFYFIDYINYYLKSNTKIQKEYALCENKVSLKSVSNKFERKVLPGKPVSLTGFIYKENREISVDNLSDQFLLIEDTSFEKMIKKKTN